MGKTFNRYIMTDGVKSIDLPQFPNEAWQFYGEADDDGKEDFYSTVAAVFRATNLTASATANIPFALVDKSGNDYDVSTEWENKVLFMPKPNELIRLWRLSLIMTNTAYGFMENKKETGKNLRYIVPTTISPITDNEKGLTGFKRTIGTGSKDYLLGKNNPIFWMWRMDHTTELLPAKATEFQAMCAAAGILYYSDHFVNAFFKRGGIKPTMLVLKGMTTKENIEKIESVWDKIIKGGYKYLGKIFQGVDTNGGLEAQTIGEGVDTLKDETLTKSKIEDVAMSIGMPLSLLLANSANYATALVEYKEWYENSLAPWCDFMAEEMNDKLFKPLGLRFEFRPEMTDPGQEDEVARASAYSTYVNAGIKPSVAAQVIGMELPEGIEYEALDEMQEEKRQQAIEMVQKKQGSSDTQSEKEKPDALQKEKKEVGKFVPSLDQLHELETWRKFAFRKNKKGESLDFPFDVKTLPDDIADGIRERLLQATDEDSIKAAFELKYSPDQARDEVGRWTEEGNTDNSYGELIKKTDTGDEIYQLRNAKNLPNKSIIAVQMTGKNIYISTDTDMTHGKMIREINGIDDSVDNYVRFEYGYGNRNEMIASIASAGVIVDSSWFDGGKTRAIDNIYKAIDKLVSIGLPTNTVVRIMDYGNPDILTTAKSFSPDYAILELADAINKAAELSVLPEIRATEQPMIVADLVEPTNESN
jgi:hypothetical protein